MTPCTLQFSLMLALNLVWLGKDVVIQVYLSKKSENVYLTMEDLKSVCLQRMSERGASSKQIIKISCILPNFAEAYFCCIVEKR